MLLPADAGPFLAAFAPHFTHRTYARFLTLTAAAILTAGRRHRTPAQLLCRLVRVLLRRFPGRRFVLAGDSSYGTHEVARFCHRHRRRLTLVSKLCPDATLFTRPPPYVGNGRPRVKGDRLTDPAIEQVCRLVCGALLKDGTDQRSGDENFQE